MRKDMNDVSRQVALSELKIEIIDLQSRVTTGNVLKFFTLITLNLIWATLLFLVLRLS